MVEFETDDELSQRLFDDMGEFVNTWSNKNCDGMLSGETAIAALQTHLGNVIGNIPCQHCRATMLEDVIRELVQAADAPVVVSVHSDHGAAAIHTLELVEPKGRA